MLKISADELAVFSVRCLGALQKPEEFSPLLEMVDAFGPKVVLEIGVGNCGSTWAFSKLSSVEHIICIDLPAGPWGGAPKEATEERLQRISSVSGVPVSFISGNSQNSECFEHVTKLLDGKSIDFLFIDGDHSYEGVKTDFLTYSPLVSKPGLIGFHDVSEHAPESGCNVKKFWDEIKASGIPAEDYTEFVLATEPSWGGLGVVRWS